MKLMFKGASVFNIEDLVGLDDKGQAKLDKAIADFKAECNKEANHFLRDAKKPTSD